MNKITTFAIQSANKAEEERLDAFQLREIVKQIVYDAYRLGLADAMRVFEKNLAEKAKYENDNPRL